MNKKLSLVTNIICMIIGIGIWISFFIPGFSLVGFLAKQLFGVTDFAEFFGAAVILLPILVIIATTLLLFGSIRLIKSLKKHD